MARRWPLVLVLACSLCLALSYPGTVASRPYIGGDPSARLLENALIGLLKNKTGISIPPFANTTSRDGLTGFMSGKYLVGVTDTPMSVIEEKQLRFQKFTVPQLYSTMSFVTSLAPGLRLSPNALVGIFKGKYQSWKQLGVDSDLAIIPVVRSDYTGAQRLMTTYLHRAAKKDRAFWRWPITQVGNGPFPKAWPGNAIQVNTHRNMGLTLQSTPGSIGFMQSGIALITYKLNEVAIKNLAGMYSDSKASGDPMAALPRNPPPASGSWSSVDCVFKDGPQTYPIVFFFYNLYRQSYKGIRGGAAVKQWALNNLTPDAQKLYYNYLVYGLPPAYLDSGVAAARHIKV